MMFARVGSFTFSNLAYHIQYYCTSIPPPLPSFLPFLLSPSFRVLNTEKVTLSKQSVLLI